MIKCSCVYTIKRVFCASQVDFFVHDSTLTVTKLEIKCPHQARTRGKLGGGCNFMQFLIRNFKGLHPLVWHENPDFQKIRTPLGKLPEICTPFSKVCLVFDATGLKLGLKYIQKDGTLCDG